MKRQTSECLEGERRKERGERKNMSCKIVQGRKNEGTKNGPV